MTDTIQLDDPWEDGIANNRTSFNTPPKHIYKSLHEFLQDHPEFSLSEGALTDGDWEDEVFDWLSSQNFNVLVCSEEAIIYN